MAEFNDYLKSVAAAVKAGNATEHTHRSFLKTLIESADGGITATNEPKRIACGAPDYIVTKGEIAQGEIPLGYIEAKDVGENLDKAENSEQLKRYKDSLSNLILTDYLEFRWFVRGEKRLTVKLAELDKSKRITLTANGAAELSELFDNFLTIQIPTVATPRELAERMASIARLIKVTIEKALTAEKEDDREPDFLHDQMQSFQKVLLPDLSETQFADLYAQTIAYGLFSARCNTTKPPFTRLSAGSAVPRTNPFLRQLFDNIAGINLDERITWAVDDLAELLNRSDMSAILADFGKRTRQEDPIVHFYETFLAAYDPKLRETRGVYYTPEPVVSYIVRSVDKILQTNFGLSKGLADSSKIKIKSADGKSEIESHKLLILDPATGTGTFLYSVIKHIAKQFERNKGMWDGYVSEHLLPRIFGFELLVAPYAVAHLKLGLLLDETGYKFQSNERLRVFLTNTLEEVDRLTNVSGLTRWLNDEADSAAKIKEDAPVMVVLGNPPYSGHSANTGNWIKQLLHGVDSHTGKLTENYFEVDGKPLGEKNPKWLNDDYVKFIRFAQWRIEQTGFGVLAFVTNHGYLDNPTFRGMRESLMKTFDEIHVLDLHGNAKKKEKSPDGTKDENVFDIQQGVAIGIFVKKKSSAIPLEQYDEIFAQMPKSRKDEQGRAVGDEAELTEADELALDKAWATVAAAKKAKVFHKHLYGGREVFIENADGERELTGGKYAWLLKNDSASTDWTEIKPTSPFYLFTPQDETLREEYQSGWKMTEMMPTNVLGFQTHRDEFAIDFDESSLKSRIIEFRDKNSNENSLRTKYQLGLWNFSKLRIKLRENKDWQQAFTKCLYRPFDLRHSFYNETVMDRPRREILNNVLNKDNLVMNLARIVKLESWRHALVSKFPSTAISMDINGSYIFPLYLYSTEKEKAFGAPDRLPNFSDEFIAEFSEKLNLEFVPDGKLVESRPPAHAGGSDRSSNFFTPEDIFHYAYAVFHAPTYRARYAEFLKIDFPRLPLTSSPALFRLLASFGADLVNLHLLEREIDSSVTFPEKGSNEVEFVKYEAEKVWINKTQFFENVPETIWNFHIGGYQVCQKWLKDRKGRTLAFDDLEHYARIVAALTATADLMTAIDETIEDNGSFPIE